MSGNPKLRTFAAAVWGMLFAAFVPCAADETNLARNPGFEDCGDTAWSLGKHMSIEKGIGRNGSRGVRICNPDPTCRDVRLWQRGLPAESGRIYSYEAWVRLGGGLTNGPVYFNMTCYGRDGRSLCTVEGRPLIRQPQLKGKGWVKVSGATARTPAGTASVGIGCIFPFNCTGEVFVDDFKVTASEKRYVEYVYTSAYRDLAVDGPVTFAVPYICDPEEHPVDDLAPEFLFVGKDGKECRMPADRVGKDASKDTSFEVKIDVSRLAFGTQKVKAILRTKGGKTLDEAEVPFTRAAKRPPRKVWFDSRKRLIVEGKPFFPLGMYFGKNSKEEFEVYRQAAFNTVFCGSSIPSLDLVHAQGLKAIVNTASFVEPEKLERVLHELKDHPAVLAWYTNDEMPPGLVPRQAMLQKVYRRVDPDHPTYSVLDKPWQVRLFMPTFDVIGMDPYPIGNHRGGIDISYGWAASCVRQSFGMRPMWQVPQAFDWRWYRDGLDEPEFRFPAPDEFRSMTWQAIAAGANGLMYFSFGSMRSRMKKPGEFERHWSYVKDTVAEVAKYVPVILSDGEPPQVDGATQDVPVRAWRSGNDVWLLAVNTMRHAQKATLRVEGAPAKAQKAHVAFGPAPEILSDGRLSFSLGPLEQTLLRLSPVEKAHFTLLKCNSPGTAYMKGGLCSSAVVGDFDGDGDDDVYLAAGGCTKMSGTWFFENVSPKGAKGAPTAFKPRVRRGHCGAGIRCELADGSSAVVAGNSVNYDFLKNPTAFKPLAPDLPKNIHFGKVRANYWRLKDFDGDGRDDIVVGVGDWREYTWENRYTQNGIWTNAQAHGYMYVVRNEGGARGHEKWGTPQQLRIENGDPAEVFGNASPMLEDWDGDGDLDVISGDFRDNWTFFENIGTRTAPVYTSGRLLRGSDGRRLRADLCITRPCACDWDGDGLLDFLSGEEDGRLGFYRNTGKVVNGLPVFDQPAYVRAQRDYVHFGILCTPWVVDWDGDGDQDIIAGNSAGYVSFIENLSGPGVANPKWDEPKCLPCEKGGTEPITSLPGTYPIFEYEPFRILAGPNGSIQGPCEAIWGYTCLSAEDWDGDGDIDVMLNNTIGKIILLRNVGTRTKPKLGPPEGVEVEWDGQQPERKWGWFQASKTPNAKEIVTQWRTTPIMHDMNGDGLMDLVLVDTEGYLAYFERFRKTDGALALKSPRRAFLDDATGAPMGVSGWSGNGKGRAGSAGRRKICIVDWDGDGKKDIVMNSARVGGNAVLWRQTKSGNGTWSFRNVGDFTDDKLEWHSTSPCACDFDGNGVPDLLLGAEDGFFYHLRNNR